MPKAARALEWTKGFNNARPTDRIAFLQRVEKLDDNERPKLNGAAVTKLLEYMINVSAAKFLRVLCTSRRQVALLVSCGALARSSRDVCREAHTHRPARAHCVRASQQEAREETVEDANSKCINAGSFRLGLSIVYEAVFLVSWPRFLRRRSCA